MSVSWIKSCVLETDNKVNYTKLCRLLYDGGTLAVRTVFDGIVSPASLGAKLIANQHILRPLKRPRGRVLSQDQWNQLYPPSGACPKSDDFDITLLFVLLRNICGLTPPATGWDALPPTTDTSLGANLVRIKYYRNKVAAHCSKAEVDSREFANYWSDISGALVALGLKQDDIDNLKTSPLGQKNYNQLVKEWDLSDQDIKSQLESLKLDSTQLRTDTSHIKTDTSQLKTDTSHIKTDTSQLKTDTTELKLCASNIDSRTSQMKSDIAEIKNTVKPTYNAIDRLALRDVNTVIDRLCDKYHPNTREWLINDVKLRVNHEHCVVIKAGPGMGKSVVAAKLCQEFKNLGVLGGCHFFKHDNSLHNNPRLMLQSVSRQLCDMYPKYRDNLNKGISRDLGKDISELTCKELWSLLFEEPCSKLKPKCHFVIVIDALDECCNELKEDLFITLKQVSTLPPWLRFVLTTRPPPHTSSLRSIGYSVGIDPKDSKNTEDLQTYMADKLGELGNIRSVRSEDEKRLNRLIDITEGLFLVAYFLIDLLANTAINSIYEAVNQFPKENGIGSIYEDYFSRLRRALLPHIHSEKGFYDMLEGVVTAKYPIEKTMFYSILGLKKDPGGPTKRKWKEAINLLHQLFPVENDHVSAFHKTVIDWLTSKDHDHDFNVKDCDCIVLANKCYEVVLALKQNVKQIVTLDQPPSLTDRDKYALSLLFEYIDGSKGFSEVKRTEMENDGYLMCLMALFDVQNKYNNDSYYDLHFEGFINIFYFLAKFLFLIYLRHPTKNMSPKFTQVLACTYQSLLLENGKNKEILEYFKASRAPYIERKHVLKLNTRGKMWFVEHNNSEVVVKEFNNGTPFLCIYQLDGTLVKELAIDSLMNYYKSADGRLIVLLSKSKSAIEIIDAASFEIKATYPSPSAVRSCHVFGCQPWYMVLRCEDDMLYVIDVETGKSVVQPTVIHQHDSIVGVSKEGHIVIQEYITRAHKDGALISLYLCSYQAISEKIELYPKVEYCRQCYNHMIVSSSKSDYYAYFSDDSELLALTQRSRSDGITIVRTSDGSLYRSVSRCYLYGRIDDLFVSKERMFVLMKNYRKQVVLLCIKFGENECDTVMEHFCYLGHCNGFRIKLNFWKVLVSEDKVSFTTIFSSYDDNGQHTIDTYTLVDSPCHM